jgi:hypothetical protein
MRVFEVLAIASMLTSGGILASVLPPNDLGRQDRLVGTSIIDEARFNQIIDDVIARYRPVFDKHQASLMVNKYWESSEVNASADQVGGEWIINMYGGLARRPELTEDAFALAVCHEIGHHLGGYHFKDSWASSEGQADYFAAQACARKIWQADLVRNAAARDEIGAYPKGRCDEIWSNESERNLCYRVALASKSLATLLWKISEEGAEPQFETPDDSVVAGSRPNHPDAQCRLDTYFQAALCPVNFDDWTIPGKGHSEGRGSLGAEFEAAKVSCTQASLFEVGTRPLCWFKPHLELLTSVPSTQWVAVSGDDDAIVEPGESWEVVPMIQNDGQQKFPDVGAKLISTDPLFDVTKPDSNIGDIDSGEARQARGLVMRVSESAPCGAKLPFALGAHIGDAEKWYDNWIYVGEPTLSPMWRDDERTTVDGYYTVVRELHVDENYAVRRVNVNLHFDTQHANFFKITLVSPSRDQYVIHDRTQTEQFEVKGLFDFMAASDDVRGTWQLVMENYNTIPGELVSWDLSFADYHCR